MGEIDVCINTFVCDYF